MAVLTKCRQCTVTCHGSRYLLGSCTYSVRAFCFGCCVCHLSLFVICLSRVRSRKLSEIGAKFHRLYRKSGLPSKNMTSDFAPEVVKYPKSRPTLQNSQKECASLLSRSVSDAACSLCIMLTFMTFVNEILFYAVLFSTLTLFRDNRKDIWPVKTASYPERFSYT